MPLPGVIMAHTTQAVKLAEGHKGDSWNAHSLSGDTGDRRTSKSIWPGKQSHHGQTRKWKGHSADEEVTRTAHQVEVTTDSKSIQDSSWRNQQPTRLQRDEKEHSDEGSTSTADTHGVGTSCHDQMLLNDPHGDDARMTELGSHTSSVIPPEGPQDSPTSPKQRMLREWSKLKGRAKVITHQWREWMVLLPLLLLKMMIGDDVDVTALMAPEQGAHVRRHPTRSPTGIIREGQIPSDTRTQPSPNYHIGGIRDDLAWRQQMSPISQEIQMHTRPDDDNGVTTLMASTQGAHFRRHTGSSHQPQPNGVYTQHQFQLTPVGVG